MKILALLLAAGALLLWPCAALALEVITFIGVAATNAALGAGLGGASWAIGSAVAAISQIAIGVGVSIGVSALSSLLTKKAKEGPQAAVRGSEAPTAQEVHQTIKQAVAPRRRHYGSELKVGGVLAFFHSKDGALYMLILFSHGEVAHLVEHWLNDKPVTVNAAGNVIDAQYTWNATNRVSILARTGTTTQSAYPQLISAFPEMWSEQHRLLGIANVLIIARDVPTDVFTEVYPAGPPQYRIRLWGARVYDMRLGQSAANPATWAASDNPALIILDYLTHADGMARPRSMFDEASFQLAAEQCDAPVVLKTGGTEKRYRLSGSYDLSERPADVLGRMLAVCDGELYQTEDGTYGLRVGVWDPPTKTIASDHVLRFRFEQGSNALAVFNIVKSIYVSPLHDYQESQAEDWRDEDLIVAMGEERAEELRILMCTSHSQARRLAKIAMAKGNPEWRGTIVTDMSGLELLGERVIMVDLPLMGFEQTTFTINEFRMAGDLTQCELSVSSISAAAYEWDPATEEGTAPTLPPAFPPTSVIAVPEDFGAAMGDPGMGNWVSTAWSPPERDTLSHEINIREQGVGDWSSSLIPHGMTTWQSPVLPYAAAEVRLRARSPGGKASDWTATLVIDFTAPAIATDVITSVTDDDVTIDWVNSESPNLYETRLYRNTVDNINTAVHIHNVLGSVGTAQSFVDLDLPSGTYFYWLQSSNVSGITSEHHIGVAGGLTSAGTCHERPY